MRKTALAGALALAAITPLFASNVAWSGEAKVAPAALNTRANAETGSVVTTSHLARLKTALKLSDDQRRLWPAIEAAFYRVARSQQSTSVSMLGHRAHRISVVMNATSMRELAGAALPLIRTLDDNQKLVVIAFANRVGMGQLASAL